MPSYEVNDPSKDKEANGGDMTGSDTKVSFQDSASSPTLTGSPTKRSRPKLEHQASVASARRRSISARRMSSSFNFPHINSYISQVPSEEDLEDIDLDAVPWWTSKRLQLAILCFVGFVSLYAQRVNLSIAIVSMVKDHAKHKQSQGNLTANGTGTNYSYPTTTLSPEEEKCPELSKSETEAEFDWDKKLTGLILGAFFWGYLVLQVPGGQLSEKFGAKKVIGYCMFPVAILNVLSPVVARANPYAFLVLRVFVGVGEGVMYPAAQTLWSKWAPPNERSRLIGFSYAGGQFGNAIIFPIGGYLSAYGFDGGWPSVFYVIGTFGFLWCVAWMIFAHDTPDNHPTIGDLEKKYIKTTIGDRAKAPTDTPWKKIFTSMAVWAILIAHTCGNYGAYMLLTKIPAYMKEVLKFDIKANGVFSMLPYLTFWLFINVSGITADLLISKEILSVANTRKLMSFIGMFGPAVSLVGTSYMECDQQAAAVVLLTLAVGLCGFHFSGYFINHGDIAPPYAGTLFGLSNTCATVPGFVSPYVVAAMTPNGTREEWQSTFYVAAGIYVFGAIWFGIFGKGEVQPWAGGKQDENADDDEEVGFGLHELQQVHEEEEVDEDLDKENEEKLLQDGKDERSKDV